MHWLGALGTMLYCSGIFYLSSQSLQVNETLKIPGMDKLVHMVLYGGLAFVVSWGLRHAKRGHRPTVQFWIPILFTCLYGMSDEWHQSLVPLREFDPWDVVADTAGAIVFQVALCIRFWGLPWRDVVPGISASRE